MRPFSIISTLSSLVFPIRCPSCQISLVNDSGICRACRESINPKVLITFRGQLKIFAGSRYTPNLSRIILGAKETNLNQARIFLAERLTDCLIRAKSEIEEKNGSRVESIVIIPIPSNARADRKRGFAHIQLLIAELIARNKNLTIEVLDCLHHIKKISDQSSLNFNERALNMKGAFAVDEILYFEIYPVMNSNSLVFLVDDLVTTGATVQAANLALSTLGGRVDGVLASCATEGFTH